MIAATILTFYRGLGWGLRPFLVAFLRWRRAHGKEHPDRWRERLGETGLVRPSGSLIWLHGASVGESLALLPLIAALQQARPDLFLLVTSGTVTSAALLGARLPLGARHQFVPIDAPWAVDAFLAHWRPDLVLWTESDLWPTSLMRLKARGIPALLLNGRLSDRSFQRWRRVKPLFRHLLGCFTEVLARGPEDAARFRALGAPRVRAVGNLKLAAAPLPVDEQTLAEARAKLEGRPILVAASTHLGEEALIAATHRALSGDFPALVTIIAPRHPFRGPEIGALLNAACRSRGAPLPLQGLYIADTMGELGLWYRLAWVAVIGGSFLACGGHNPIEAARLGCPVIFGPHMENFREEAAALLREERAALASAATLAGAIERALKRPRPPPEEGKKGEKILATILARVEALLPEAPTSSHVSGGAEPSRKN